MKNILKLFTIISLLTILSGCNIPDNKDYWIQNADYSYAYIGDSRHIYPVKVEGGWRFYRYNGDIIEQSKLYSKYREINDYVDYTEKINYKYKDNYPESIKIDGRIYIKQSE